MKNRSPAPDATRKDGAAFIERFGVPAERLRVRTWPLFARALAREARSYELPVPRWLIYPKPATTFRAVKNVAERDRLAEFR